MKNGTRLLDQETEEILIRKNYWWVNERSEKVIIISNLDIGENERYVILDEIKQKESTQIVENSEKNIREPFQWVKKNSNSRVGFTTNGKIYAYKFENGLHKWKDDGGDWDYLNSPKMQSKFFELFDPIYPIAFTVNNEPIFEGQYPWIINTRSRSLNRIYQWCTGGYGITEKYSRDLLFFSSEEDAKQYILAQENEKQDINDIKCLSINDVAKIYVTANKIYKDSPENCQPKRLRHLVEEILKQQNNK